MPEREKGLATSPCPTCGHELTAQVQADGGIAADPCPTCNPVTAPAPEQASTPAPVAGRERGTPQTPVTPAEPEE